MDLKWALAFIEGEGSFFIAITRNRAGWYLRPRFSVSLHIDDKLLLEEMELLFNKYNIKTNLAPEHGQVIENGQINGSMIWFILEVS